MRFQGGVAPVVAGRTLRVASHAIACGFEQRLGGSGIESGIFSRRQVEFPAGKVGFVAIVINEGA